MRAHPAAELFPMLGEDDLAKLAEDIKINGQKHPIVRFGGEVLDGRNRLAACGLAGVAPVFEDWTPADGESPWDYVWSTNVHRRHLEASQVGALAVKFTRASDEWKAEQESAKQKADDARSSAARRQHAVSNPRIGECSGAVSKDTGPEFIRRRPLDSAQKAALAALSEDLVQEFVPPKDGGKSLRERARLAEKANVSPATIARAIELEKKAPEKFEAVARGETTLTKALAEVKLDAKRTLAAELDSAPVPLPGGKYHVIAIDPPWKYDARVEDASHRGRNQYPDMTIEQLAALPVGDLAEADSVLWLWVTNAFMREAYQLLDAWGFTAKTILTWDKVNLGLGDYLRNVTEHCIVAVRGRPVLTLTNQTTLISEKRREHSRKPDAFYAMVESLCHGSKVEMFSRAPREGWAAWGAETSKFTPEAA